MCKNDIFKLKDKKKSVKKNIMSKSFICISIKKVEWKACFSSHSITYSDSASLSIQMKWDITI